MIKKVRQHQEGFALLMTIIVLGVVVSVGLTIVELTIKQIRLSTNARDSEIAFHAANAGIECARFHRQNSAVDIENGDPVSPTCFSTSPTSASDSSLSPTPATDGSAHQYVWEYSWGAGTPDRCSVINLISMVADPGGSGISLSGMETLVPGYPDGDVKNCATGGLCTVLAIRGYNRPCSQRNSVGTVEREVLIQF